MIQKKGIVTRITEQLARLQVRIREATELAGRNNDSVTVLAVSKKQPAEAIKAALDAGLQDFGENYLQEELNLFEEKIVNALNSEALQIDKIASASNLSTSDCLVHLLSLEFKGLVKQLPGKMFALL